MGLAEEYEDEEGSLAEHIKRLADAENQVEVLKSALEAEKRKSASRDVCQIEKCNRPVDLWCDACETPLCYRCSTRVVCSAAREHSLVDFEDIYKDIKKKFEKWSDEQEERQVVLELRQRKMLRNIQSKKRELSDAADESFTDQAAMHFEIGALLEKLEPLSKQVEELKKDLMKYGDNVDRLSKPEYFCVVKVVVDQTNSTASVSSYTPVAKVKSTTHLHVNKTPTQSPVTKTPAQPRSLQLISKYDTAHYCWSVHHHSITGDILVGGSKSVKMISSQSGEITHLADYPCAVIKEHKGAVFISSMNDGTVNIYRFNMNNKTDELLFSYSSTRVPYMSVSDHHIVCRGDDNMILYHRVYGTASTVQSPSFSYISHLQFLPDATLLVTGYKDYKDKLNKYRLSDEGEPTLIWSCDDVERGCGVSVADNGLIFVCDKFCKTIYIVSTEGKKIRDIKCDKLPGWCNDISIREDEFAVAGGNKGVLVYKIIIITTTQPDGYIEWSY